jgi:hypothetical protein
MSPFERVRKLANLAKIDIKKGSVKIKYNYSNDKIVVDLEKAGAFSVPSKDVRNLRDALNVLLKED